MPRVDYERHGATYSRHRRPDPRIAAAIERALGDARTVLNVGAGAGSYEPAGRWVLAVEPSAMMRAQRPPGAAPAIVARAEALAIERPRFPSLGTIAASLGGDVRVQSIPTPADCTDGFFEAFWNRPEALLDPQVRSAQSMWALLPTGVEERIVDRLATALASGAWDAEHGHLRDRPSYAGSLRLVVAESS